MSAWTSKLQTSHCLLQKQLSQTTIFFLISKEWLILGLFYQSVRVSWQPAITHPGHSEGKDQRLTIGSIITKVSRDPRYLEMSIFLPTHPQWNSAFRTRTNESPLLYDLPSGLIPRRYPALSTLWSKRTNFGCNSERFYPKGHLNTERLSGRVTLEGRAFVWSPPVVGLLLWFLRLTITGIWTQWNRYKYQRVAGNYGSLFCFGGVVEDFSKDWNPSRILTHTRNFLPISLPVISNLGNRLPLVLCPTLTL